MAGTWPRQSSPIRRRSPGHGDAIQQGRPAMAARWKNRPEGSNWGDFGPDDQCGRLNLLTHERVGEAAREDREGRRIYMSMTRDLPGGRDMNRRRESGRAHDRTPVTNEKSVRGRMRQKKKEKNKGRSKSKKK